MYDVTTADIGKNFTTITSNHKHCLLIFNYNACVCNKKMSNLTIESKLINENQSINE